MKRWVLRWWRDQGGEHEDGGQQHQKEEMEERLGASVARCGQVGEREREKARAREREIERGGGGGGYGLLLVCSLTAR